jgi:hypothetical protein
MPVHNVGTRRQSAGDPARQPAEGGSPFKRATSWLYYRLFNALSDVPIEAGSAELPGVAAPARRLSAILPDAPAVAAPCNDRCSSHHLAQRGRKTAAAPSCATRLGITHGLAIGRRER